MTIEEFDIQKALGTLDDVISIYYRFNIRPEEHLEYSRLTLKLGDKEYRIENHPWMNAILTHSRSPHHMIQYTTIRSILIKENILT